MRLTLRTLLAYLDDTLEPVQTKRIGQVVADNPQAQELITRIKDVVRRRRLTPPGATETNEGLDANTLAEYLDNALPPDQLAKVEETALGSDVTLAELAACHQILTLLQTEPPLVPPAARGRMYGLAKGPQAATAPRKKVAADVPSPAPAPTQEPASAAPAASSSSPWFRQAAILAGVFLLGILITVAVLYSLRGVWQKSPVHVAPAGPNTEVALNKGPSPEEKAAAAKEEQEKKEKQAAADKLTATLKAAAEKEAAEKAAQQKAAAEKAAAEKGAAEPKTAPEKENPPLPDNPPSTDRVEVGTYVVSRDSPSILLDRQENTAPWKRVADRSPVFSNDTLVSLPGYRSEVDLKSGVHLVLWGNLLPDGRPVSVLESAGVVHNNSEVDADVTLSRGKLLVSNHKNQGPAVVLVRFVNQIWRLTLPETDAEVYLELWGQDLPRVTPNDKMPVGPEADLALIVLKGNPSLQFNQKDSVQLHPPPKESAFFWNNVGSASSKATALPVLPNWLTYTPPTGDLAKVLTALSDRLSRGPVEEVLPALLKDADPPSRRLGVYCLGAVDDLSNLLDALSDENHSEVRLSAVVTLEVWLDRGPGQDQVLHAILEKKFSPESAEIILELLHTFSTNQLSDPETWAALINYLKNSKMAIRELANWQLVNLLPSIAQQIMKTQPYDLAGGPEQRDKAYAAWKQFIPDGKLPQLPTAPTNPTEQRKPPGT